MFLTVFAVTVTVAACPPPSAQTLDEIPRERISIDRGWRFALGDANDPTRDFGFGTTDFFYAKTGFGDGPASLNFNDAGWRLLDLPHDWAVEMPFDRRARADHGFKAVGPGFPTSSVGWYRRAIDISGSDRGRRITVEFDGIFRNAQVWFNGHHLGTEPSGYAAAVYDLTDYANYGGANVLVVRVDASIGEGWFYEGAGIYRHVWLTRTDPVHVAQSGVFVSSTTAGGNAQVVAETRIANDGDDAADVSIDQEIRDPAGRSVAFAAGGTQRIDVARERVIATTLACPDAKRWSIETPSLYRLVTTIRRGRSIIDRVETPFGVRTVRWDAATGFWLNGRNVKLKGVNLHQDHAGVGTALPDALIEWRLGRIKAMGANAIRVAHNPATPELLDAADRLGLLVIDEQRMMGSTPTLLGQLDRMVLRDRNHPSIILWSVGNEEWAIEGNEIGRRLTKRMQDRVHRLDPTRMTTVAMSGGMMTGSGAVAEVAGANYRKNHDLDAYHLKYPITPVVLTEEGAMRTTRGVYADDRAKAALAAYDRPPDSKYQSNMEDAWRFVSARPWLAGMFVWTGLDYRGEPRPFGWPAILSQSGMADLTGEFKDNGWFLKSQWSAPPMVHVLPHWTWPGHEGQPIAVWVYGNTQAVELFLNGRSLGRKSMPQAGHLEWGVPYQPGVLEARAFAGGKQVASDLVATAGTPAALRLSTDRSVIAADSRDVAIVSVVAVDRRGRVVPIANNKVTFTIEGGGRLIGVGNGDPAGHDPERFVDPNEIWWRSLFNGHAQAIVEAGDRNGKVVLTAAAPGLEPARITITLTGRNGQ
jgi:beta-galactosidase